MPGIGAQLAEANHGHDARCGKPHGVAVTAGQNHGRRQDRGGREAAEPRESGGE